MFALTFPGLAAGLPGPGELPLGPDIMQMGSASVAGAVRGTAYGLCRWAAPFIPAHEPPLGWGEQRLSV